jgi:hypothetical protein
MSEWASVIGNTVTFVVLFVILMALTYAPLYPFDQNKRAHDRVAVPARSIACCLIG